MKTALEKETEIVLPENLWDKYSEKSTNAHHRLVEAIFKQIEIKDINTANHCRAVAYYSECIGICMGLDKRELSLLKDAAMLHDDDIPHSNLRPTKSLGVPGTGSAVITVL